MSVVDTAEILKGSSLSDEEYFQAAILGWCVELVSSWPSGAPPRFAGSAAKVLTARLS